MESWSAAPNGSPLLHNSITPIPQWLWVRACGNVTPCARTDGEGRQDLLAAGAHLKPVATVEAGRLSLSPIQRCACRPRPLRITSACRRVTPVSFSLSMTLPNELIQGIERFLALVPAQTRKRGWSYHAQGAVLELKCVRPAKSYAAVVRGGTDYEVTLDFEDRVWSSDCSCPMVYDCKHAVAAFLELQKRVVANGGAASAKAGQSRSSPKLKPSVPQPPRTPIYIRLTEHLGRELERTEADFILRVQHLHNEGSYRQLTENDLGVVAIGRNFYSWQPLELWPDFPRDDYHLWLYIAWELRRRQAAYPEFMDAITDFRPIENEMAEWEREKEIARWKDWFRDFQGAQPDAPAGTLELRLVIHPTEARLQWRTESEAAFADFKRDHAKRFADQFERGALDLAHNSLALWSAVFKPWNHESWWSFKYDFATARPALNRLLRMPLAPDRVVTPDGQPLVRAGGLLSLTLSVPENGNEHYELALSTADGSPLPKILCTLSGQPTLYLTEGGLYSGPPADALDTELCKRIPAAAMESADGLRFLHATGVPLPEHFAQRVRTVPVRITLSCNLKPVYPGSKSEDIVIKVVAKAPGMRAETFTRQGWQAQSQNGGAPKAEKGVITLHDRAAQQQFPRLLDGLGVKWADYPGEWRLRLNKKTPEVFVPWLKSLPPEFEVLLDPELATLRDEPVSGSVSLDIEESGVDWFDLKVALKVTDTTLTPEELKLLLNARGGYVRLGQKGWRRLHFNLTPEEDEQLARLGLHAKDFSAEPQRFHALQLADDAAKTFLAPERVEQIQRRVSELKTRVAPPLPPAIRAELRPYQRDGYHFLAYLTANHFGGMLADDMGLGKTVQALAWLAWLRQPSAFVPQPFTGRLSQIRHRQLARRGGTVLPRPARARLARRTRRRPSRRPGRRRLHRPQLRATPRALARHRRCPVAGGHSRRSAIHQEPELTNGAGCPGAEGGPSPRPHRHAD